MNSQLQSYVEHFDDARARVIALTADLNDESFNRRPPSCGWSTGEVIDHLCVLGELMLPRFDIGIAEARTRGWNSDGPFRYPYFSRWFIRAVGPLKPGKRGKMKAPKMYLPRPDLNMPEVLARFDGLQTGLITRCERANGLDIARVSIASPVTRLIRVRLGAWIEAIAAHQLRHFEQIRDMRKAIGLAAVLKVGP